MQKEITSKLPMFGYKENKIEQNPNNLVPEIAYNPIKQQLPMNADLSNSCIEKPIENLFQKSSELKFAQSKVHIPNLEEKKENPSGKINLTNQEEMKSKHPHYIDFYKSGKKYLTYFESIISVDPMDSTSPYSDFSKIVGNLKYLEYIQKNQENKVSVILYENEKRTKFIIKTYWEKSIYCSTGNQEDNDKIDFFLSQKYNECKLSQLYSACPHSVSPFDFHFVYLKEKKILLSELLQAYGGESIPKYLVGKKLNSKEIFTILLQITEALNYMECYNIEHNDIKAGNVLVDFALKQPIIKIIDLDIGMHQSLTIHNVQRSAPLGYTNYYVPPEIIRMIARGDTENDSNKFDPRKSQIYSLGILILQLTGFFSEKVYATFDNCKLSDIEYKNKFVDPLQTFFDNCEDYLKKKILKIIQYCTDLSPNKRLTANQLLNCVEGLDRKELSKIEMQYKEEISKISQPSFTGNLANSNNRFENILYANQNPRFNNAPNFYLYPNNISKNEEEKDDQIKKLELEKVSLMKANEEAKIKQLENENKSLKIIIDDINQKIKVLKVDIAKINLNYINLNIKKEELQKEIEILKKQNNVLLMENQNYKKFSLENETQFENLKMKMKEFKIADFNNSNSCYELADNLIVFLMKLEADYNNVKTKYVENLDYSDNTIYSGPVNENNLPNGAGILLFKDPFKKFIGEFEDGTIKNNFGFMIVKDKYYFGRIIKGICQNPTFYFSGCSTTLGNGYYFGDSEKNKRKGIGKRVLNDGAYYEGQWDDDEMNGKGKYTYSNGEYYEGDFVGSKFQGKEKYVYPNKDYYDGDFQQSQRQGKGKFVYENGDYFDGNYLENKRNGEGILYEKQKDPEKFKIYKGNWINDKREGKFEITEPDGKKSFAICQENKIIEIN